MKNNLAVALAVAALATGGGRRRRRARLGFQFRDQPGLEQPRSLFRRFRYDFRDGRQIRRRARDSAAGRVCRRLGHLGSSVVSIYGASYLFSLTLQFASTSSDDTSGSVDINSTALSNGWYLGASYASAVTADCIGACSTTSPVSDYVVTGYTSVPGPSVGAGLPAVLIGLAGLLGWRRTRGGSGQEQVRR